MPEGGRVAGAQNWVTPTSGVMRPEQFLHMVFYLGWVISLHRKRFPSEPSHRQLGGFQHVHFPTLRPTNRAERNG